MDNIARNQHLEKLRRQRHERQRNFVLNGERIAQNVNTNNLVQGHQTKQIPPPSYPIHYTTTPIDEPPHTGPYNLVNQVSHDPFHRRYSVASYPQVYIPQYQLPNPVYYIPNGSNRAGSNSCFQRFVNPGIATHAFDTRLKIQSNKNDEKEDDDVFTSNQLNEPQTSNIQNSSIYPNTDTNSILAQLQSRKRAHSAGDMSLIKANSLQQRRRQMHVFNVPTLQNHVNVHSVNQLNSNNQVNHIEPSPKKKCENFICHNKSNLDELQPKSFHLKSHSCPLRCNALTQIDSSLKNSDFSSQEDVKKQNSLVNPTSEKSKKNKICENESGCSFSSSKKKFSKILKDTNLPSISTNITLTTSKHKLSSKKKVLWNDQIEKKIIYNDNSKINLENSTDSLCNFSKENLSTKRLEAQIKAKPLKYTANFKIGPYLIGPRLGNCAVKNISQYIVRKENTNKYFMAKILNICGASNDIQSGKILLHTEHSLLSLLSSHKGVVHQHGMFMDYSYDSKKDKFINRFGLILDCLTRHEYIPNTHNFINLQQYVIQAKRLSEKMAIRVFYSIISNVYSLHKINVVHRDLKLGNMILDVKTRNITLTNFGLGCHLSSENDLLHDQRGSPAYISPDVLSDKPYAGKPSDMWSLGVILFTMLYGQFPFYDSSPKKLFTKIKLADYTMPNNGMVSTRTNEIIKGLLTLNPDRRLTAQQTLSHLESILGVRCSATLTNNKVQLVPDVDDIPVTVEDAQSIDKEKFKEEQLTLSFRQKLLSEDTENDEFFKSGISNTTGLKNSSLVEVTHLNYDAFPLSNEEMLRHQYLLSCSRRLSTSRS